VEVIIIDEGLLSAYKMIKLQNNSIGKQGRKIMVERSQVYKCEMYGNIVVV
jgi:hypothetical protein